MSLLFYLNMSLQLYVTTFKKCYLKISEYYLSLLVFSIEESKFLVPHFTDYDTRRTLFLPVAFKFYGCVYDILIKHLYW